MQHHGVFSAGLQSFRAGNGRLGDFPQRVKFAQADNFARLAVIQLVQHQIARQGCTSGFHSHTVILASYATDSIAGFCGSASQSNKGSHDER